MKTRKILALLLAVIMTAALAACGTPASPSRASFTVTDMTGRTIAFDKPAEKIVAITASDCEIVFALGAGETVVGRGEFCDYPAEVSAIPSVKSGADMNIEQIIALKPDAVLMSTMDQTKEQVASLENAGLRVVISDAQNIDGVYTAITLIGQVVGKNDEAKSVIDGMKKTFEDIGAKVQADGSMAGKTVYFEVSPLQYGLYAAGSGTFMDELASMLGVTNIFTDMAGWPQVSEEQVIQRNPDFIVTTTMSFEGALPPIDEIMSRKGWDGITAIKSGKVLNADSNAATRPGPRLAEAASDLYSFIYGN